jgi:hypothetical protein
MLLAAEMFVFHLVFPVKVYAGNISTVTLAFSCSLYLQPGEFARTELHFLAVV